ncbi:MAG: hypothetical protein H0U55_02820 [Rubrobacteraceae bacterium]|nr:hypothetical protein [Rubrobacteraceae bacterium]
MSDQRGNLGLDGHRANPWSACRLLCVCGYRVRCEVMRYGESLGEFVFIDDKEASTTWGERVWNCPGCHDRLGLLGLRP